MAMESGESSLPPMNMIRENPELRWSFIRKIYSITIFQLLLIIAVVSVVLFVPPVADFFNSKLDTVLYKFLIFVVSVIVLRLPQKYLHTHPLKYFLLLFINVSSALPIGLTCVFAGGKIVLEIVILITIMMFISTLYTFWAAKSDHDSCLLHSFLFGSFSILIFLSFIQILFPLGIPLEKLLSHNFGCLVSIIVCGNFVYLTNLLIKTFNYDQHMYIIAFVCMYIFVIITLFIPLLILCYKFRETLKAVTV